MAIAIRQGRTPRVGAEMALHGVELMEKMLQAAEEYCFKSMTTTFERPSPMPEGRDDSVFAYS